MPNEKERKKLEKIYRNQGLLKRYSTYTLYLALILIVIKHFLKGYPVVEYAVAIIIILMLLALFYLFVKNDFIRKCPRCATRGVPSGSIRPTRCSCPQCGLFLDLPGSAPRNDEKPESS